MKIDYKKEVDSGYDRKRIVEESIVKLLEAGIPVEIVTSSKTFNFNHHEMARNLEKGYRRKEEQLLDVYGGYGIDPVKAIVGDPFSGVSHPVGGELYPMTSVEEKAIFQKRDEYFAKIIALKKEYIKEIKSEIEVLSNEMVTLKNNYPIIGEIIKFKEEVDTFLDNKEGSVLANEKIIELCKKHGLAPERVKQYDELYLRCIDLENKLKEKYEILTQASDDKVPMTLEIIDYTEKMTQVEDEIIKRNTKLVNAFIRRKYADLLVDTQDLFQTCYIGMWKAVKDFNYKQGNKFSSLAYVYMENEIKSHFKELTGFNWNIYWQKKKIIKLLGVASQYLGRKATVLDLVNIGLLDMPEKQALKYADIISEHAISDLFPDREQEYDSYLIDSNYQMYYGDDEIKDFEEEDVDELDKPVEDEAMKTFLKDNINIVLNTLTDRERDIIILRYGLKDGVERTFKEIGEIMNLSAGRVGQIEKRALGKLRHPEQNKLLEDFIR